MFIAKMMATGIMIIGIIFIVLAINSADKYFIYRDASIRARAYKYNGVMMPINR